MKYKFNPFTGNFDEAGSGNTVNQYASLKAPQLFNPDASAVSANTDTYTLSGDQNVAFVTLNGQVLDDSEYSLTATTLTVTPDNGFSAVSDEVLVFQLNFEVTGGTGVILAYSAATADCTLTHSDYVLDATANSFTVTLPTAVGFAGKQFVVKNSGTGMITVRGDGSETIDGATTQTLSQFSSIAVSSNGTNYVITEAHKPVTQRVMVRNAADLSGTLDSGVVYFIDGEVDMGSTSIEVPPTGLQIQGLGFGVSKLVTSATSHSLFVTNGSYSGNLFIDGVEIEVTGSGSQVFNLDNDGNFGAVEMNTVNFNNCTSLGTLDAYRQGLETNTGRFGGTPNLTLSGTWTGGYRITTSIVRSLSSGMTGALFQEGTSFTMSSRFLTDINCDLPANAAFADFDNNNFTEPSLFQIRGAIFTRNGASDATDSNIMPNIDRGELSASWKNNQGIRNTYEGGKLTVSSENLTVISAGSTFYPLNAVWTSSSLQHFDSPASGQLRHLGNNPREYRFTADLTVESERNTVLEVRLMKYNASTATSFSLGSQRRQVNNLAGGRDVAFFTIVFNVALDQNDYVYLEIANNNGNFNATLELDSFYLLDSR